MNKPIAYNGEEKFIFVSYSHRNTDAVWDTLNDLQKDGFRFWYDDGIEAGSCWDDYIAEHITASGYFLAFVSGEYAASNNCIQELRWAMSLKKEVLLVRLDATRMSSGLEMRLCTYQTIKKYELDDAEYLEKIEGADGMEAFRPKPLVKTARYSYKEDYPRLMRVMKQSYYFEALFIEHEMIDNILFWCLYNMGLLAGTSSDRVRGKIRDTLQAILQDGAETGTQSGLGIGTPERKLELVSSLYAWANDPQQKPCGEAAFEVMHRQLMTERYEEYAELFAIIAAWCGDVREELTDMLKRYLPMAEGKQATLAAQGRQYAQSLNEIYREIRKGGKVRKAFGLK